MKTVTGTERIPFLQKYRISYSTWFPVTIFNDPHIVSQMYQAHQGIWEIDQNIVGKAIHENESMDT